MYVGTVVNGKKMPVDLQKKIQSYSYTGIIIEIAYTSSMSGLHILKVSRR